MGLDLGLEKTGRFQTVACVEKNPTFANTIRRNQAAERLHRRLAVIEDDVSNVDPMRVLDSAGLKPGEVDLLVGGPPCQSFSTAGRRGTVQDPRGTLIWEFLRFVQAIRPRFFLMENVRGLLSAAIRHRPIADRPAKGGPPLSPDEEQGSVIRLFSDDLQAMRDARYHMDCFLVNAVNYGAPQIRERAVFIGNRYNTEVQFPVPTHGPANGNGLPKLFPSDGTKLLPWKTLGDVIQNIADHDPVLMDFSPRKKKYLAMVPPGSNWRSLPEEIQRESMGKAWYAKGGRSGWWRRLSFGLPCPTLITMPNHASTALCHPEEVRALTVREYAAIQEFPPDWEICGSLSEQYAQIGNAVPVRLGEVSGEVIATVMDALRARRWRPYRESPEAYRVIYIQSHVRRRRWFKDGKVFVWEGGKSNEHAAYSSPKTIHKCQEIQSVNGH